VLGIIVCAVVVAGIGEFAASKRKLQSGATDLPTSISSSTPIQPPIEEIPITVKEVTSEVSPDKFVEVPGVAIATCCGASRRESQIIQLDPDIKSRTDVNQHALVAGLLDTERYSLYFTSKSNRCVFGDQEATCPNPILKIFSADNNSVRVIDSSDF